MRVMDIVPGTSVDGPGLRTAIYFAGCTHRCPGCHNPQSWDADAGREISIDEILEVVEYNGFDVTFTGGDPIFQADVILPLAREIRRRGYTIWCFTGYKYEDIAEKTEVAPLLECFEVLVDGPFVESLRDTSLVFRGSSNQRLIDIARSTVGDPVYWEDGFGVD